MKRAEVGKGLKCTMKICISLSVSAGVVSLDFRVNLSVITVIEVFTPFSMQLHSSLYSVFPAVI